MNIFPNVRNEMSAMDRLKKIFARDQENADTCLKKIPPREALVVQMYYGLNGNRAVSLARIATQLKVTRQRVHQLRIQATRRIQEMAEEE